MYVQVNMGMCVYVCVWLAVIVYNSFVTHTPRVTSKRQTGEWDTFYSGLN